MIEDKYTVMISFIDDLTVSVVTGEEKLLRTVFIAMRDDTVHGMTIHKKGYETTVVKKE